MSTNLSVEHSREKASSDQDDGLPYLIEHRTETSRQLSQDVEAMRNLRRRVDRRIMTLLCLIYALNFLDKVLLNYAQVMGMSQALHLKNNDYSVASSAFFWAVFAAAFVNVGALNKLPLSRWLSACLVVWGLLNACHASLTDYTGLLTLRVLSGFAEAGVPPTLMLISSQYYTREEQAPRFAYWYMGLGWGQMIGGLVSFGFQFTPSTSTLAGWRIMFLVLGICTMLVGLAVLRLVPNSPMQARFLTDDEKSALLEHVKVNMTSIDNKTFQFRQLWEAVWDVHILLGLLVVLLQSCGAGVVTAYSATLLRGFGYPSKSAALLNIPSGAINVVSTLAYATFVRYYGNRWLVNVSAACLAWTGAALLYFLPKHARSGLLAGLYLINVLPGANSITFHWLTCNTTGATKRAAVTTLLNAAFALGNIIGPLTFRSQDAPGYNLAKEFLLISWAVSVVLAICLYFAYRYSNTSQKRMGVDTVSDMNAFANRTDKVNTDFRYHY